MPAENVAVVSEPTVLYEDDTCMVIDKPYGWLVHGDGVNTEAPTVVGWFLGRAPQARGVGETATAHTGAPIDRSGVVHRLDRETSGALVLAKTVDAYAQLKHQFQQRDIYKEYRAFVYGRMHDRWGTINRPIGRSAKDHRVWSAQKGARGVLREAITDFERIGEGECEGEVFSYVKLLPKTGRTHQLRVHLKAIDRPIVGDVLYGAHMLERSNNLGLERLALHAHVLGFTSPSGESVRAIAPVPQAFELAAERIAE